MSGFVVVQDQWNRPIVPHCTVRPPSSVSTDPVTNLATSEER